MEWCNSEDGPCYCFCIQIQNKQPCPHCFAFVSKQFQYLQTLNSRSGIGHLGVPTSSHERHTSTHEMPTSSLGIPASVFGSPISNNRLPNPSLGLPTSSHVFPTPKFNYPTSRVRAPTYNMGSQFSGLDVTTSKLQSQESVSSTYGLEQLQVCEKPVPLVATIIPPASTRIQRIEQKNELEKKSKSQTAGDNRSDPERVIKRRQKIQDKKLSEKISPKLSSKLMAPYTEKQTTKLSQITIHRRTDNQTSVKCLTRPNAFKNLVDKPTGPQGHFRYAAALPESTAYAVALPESTAYAVVVPESTAFNSLKTNQISTGHSFHEQYRMVRQNVIKNQRLNNEPSQQTVEPPFLIPRERPRDFIDNITQQRLLEENVIENRTLSSDISARRVEKSRFVSKVGPPGFQDNLISGQVRLDQHNSLIRSFDYQAVKLPTPIPLQRRSVIRAVRTSQNQQLNLIYEDQETMPFECHDTLNEFPTDLTVPKSSDADTRKAATFLNPARGLTCPTNITVPNMSSVSSPDFSSVLSPDVPNIVSFEIPRSSTVPQVVSPLLPRDVSDVSEGK